jgi:integrase
VFEISAPDTLRGEKPRLLWQVHEAIRRLHYSRRTEDAYVHWIKRFIFWSGKRHPSALGEAEVSAFLSHLAVELNVAAATQNQALSTLLFLYKQVLGVELPWLDAMVRAKRPVRMPVVLSAGEVAALLAQLDGVHGLMAGILYGCGLRLMECLRLRVKDVDFAYRQILVRDGKGERTG